MAAAEVPIEFSKGYHPHMRMSFGPPLKTGWEGFDEYLDFQFAQAVGSFAERCNPFMPDGLKFLANSEVGSGAPKLANDICAADYQVRLRLDELDSGTDLDDETLAHNSKETISRLGGSREKEDMTPHVVSVSAHTSGNYFQVEYTTTMCGGKVVSPHEVLEMFVQPDRPDGFPTPAQVTRLAQYVSRDGEFLSPLSETVIQG
jgi:radical SAM-linked protein